MCALPENYEIPTRDSNYFKPQDGDNRVRVLTNFEIGWQYWTLDNKPVRLREQPKTMPTNVRVNENGSWIKEIWLSVVWDYETRKVAIWEITQASIKDAIFTYEKDADYGDVKKYDLKISKKGQKLDTKYSIVAAPMKPLEAHVLEAFENSDLTVESLKAMFNDAEVDSTIAPEDSPF